MNESKDNDTATRLLEHIGARTDLSRLDLVRALDKKRTGLRKAVKMLKETRAEVERLREERQQAREATLEEATLEAEACGYYAAASRVRALKEITDHALAIDPLDVAKYKERLYEVLVEEKESIVRCEALEEAARMVEENYALRPDLHDTDAAAQEIADEIRALKSD